MFVDESQFDEPDEPKNNSRFRSSNDNGRPSTGNNMKLHDIDDDDDDGIPTLGVNASSANASSSRARMLDQQRQSIMKKKQSSMLNGGMVRSSLESPMKNGTDGQNTPAIRQFSAPKKMETNDNQVESEFSRPPTSGAGRQSSSGANSSNRDNNRTSKYSDEENEHDNYRRGKDSSGRPPTSKSTRGNRYDDDDDNDNDAPRKSRDNYNNRSSGGGNDRDRDRNYRNKYSDTDEDDRGGYGSSSNRRNNKYDDRDVRDSRDRDRDRDNYNSRDNRRGGQQSDDDDWNNNNTRSRNNNNSNSRNNNKNRYDDDDYDSRDNRRGNSNNDRYDNNNNGSNSNSRSNSRNRDNDRDNNDYNDNRSGSNSNSNSNQRGSKVPNEKDSNHKWEGANSNNRDGIAQSRDKDNNNRDRDRDRDRERERDRNNNNNRGKEDLTTTGPPRQIIVAPDLSNMRHFLTSPVPKNVGVLQCYIRRNKSGTNKLYPIYSLYLKEGDVFLMASRKRPKNKTSNYLISLDQNDLNRSGPNYLGKLRSNFVGTEFQIFDNGVNPKDCDPDEAGNGDGAVRCELGAVMYAANVLGSRGPRKMQVALPGLDENGQIMKWKDSSGATTGTGSGATPNSNSDDMLARMKDRNIRDLVYLINKPPRWNEQVGAYVLNFNGRVTMASVKNFQLVDPDEQNAVVLQFGRVGKDEFTMDLQHPISPFQAFAVTLSSFDSKIACD